MWACIHEQVRYLHAVPQVVGTKNKIKKEKRSGKMFKAYDDTNDIVIIGKGKEIRWLYNKLLQKDNIIPVVINADYSNIRKNKPYCIHLEYRNSYDYDMELLNLANTMHLISWLTNKEVEDDELFNE